MLYIISTCIICLAYALYFIIRIIQDMGFILILAHVYLVVWPSVMVPQSSYVKAAHQSWEKQGPWKLAWIWPLARSSYTHKLLISREDIFIIVLQEMKKCFMNLWIVWLSETRKPDSCMTSMNDRDWTLLGSTIFVLKSMQLKFVLKPVI